MGKRKYDWNAIQKYYDEGHTYLQTCEQFGCSMGAFPRAIERGAFKSRSGREAQISRTLSHDDDRLVELARLYNTEDASWHDLVTNGPYYKSEYDEAKKRGLIKARSVSEANQLRLKKYAPNRMGVEARKALSERQSLNNSGGRCKWFWVGDQHVQGTWERDAGIKLTQLGIEWRKCAGKADILVYELDGKTRRYTPDFYLPAHDLYLEFKGYWWGDDRRKMDAVIEQHPQKNIVVVEKDRYNALLHNGDLYDQS